MHTRYLRSPSLKFVRMSNMRIPSLLAFAVGIALVLWARGVEAKEQQETTGDEDQSQIGLQGGAQISHNREKRASAEADSEICTKTDLRELMLTNEFTSAVADRVKKDLEKKNVCIKQRGPNAYYDSDLHTCGDCLDKKCIANDICMQECKQVRENHYLREKLNETSKQLEMVKNESGYEIHKLHEELTLQQKETASIKSELTEVKKTVGRLQDTTVPRSQFDSMSDKMKSVEEEVAQLRTETIGLWCFAVVCLVFSIAAIGISLTRSSTPCVQTQAVKPCDDAAAEETPLVESTDTVPSLNTTPEIPARQTAAQLPPQDNRGEQVSLRIEQAGQV